MAGPAEGPAGAASEILFWASGFSHEALRVRRHSRSQMLWGRAAISAAGDVDHRSERHEQFRTDDARGRMGFA